MRSIEAEAVPRFPTLGQLTSRDSILVIWTRNDAGGYEVYFSSKNSENNLELPNAIRLIPATSELFKLNTPRGFIVPRLLLLKQWRSTQLEYKIPASFQLYWWHQYYQRPGDSRRYACIFFLNLIRYIRVHPLCVSMFTSFIIITTSLKPHYWNFGGQLTEGRRSRHSFGFNWSHQYYHQLPFHACSAQI